MGSAIASIWAATSRVCRGLHVLLLVALLLVQMFPALGADGQPKIDSEISAPEYVFIADEVKLAALRVRVSDGDHQARYLLATHYLAHSRVLHGVGGMQNQAVAAQNEFKRLAEPLARSGHAKAQYALADCLRDSLCGGEDDANAFTWMKSSAEAGLPRAMYDLSGMYAGGRGVVKNEHLAKSWLEKSVKHHDALGLGELAERYYYGIGYPVDYNIALNLSQQAAELGDDTGMTILGLLHFGNLSTAKRDYNIARLWLERAALKDNRGAMSFLAQIYGEGLGVEKNSAEALRLRKAAGNPFFTRYARPSTMAKHFQTAAANYLAWQYFLGIEVQRDCAEGVHWLKIAEEGIAPEIRREASALRGYALHEGCGLPKDRILAKKLLSDAQAQGVKFPFIRRLLKE